MLPTDGLRDCELALQARLLVAAGRDFEFANDLIREALYVTTPEPTRLAYHQRAADLFDRPAGISWPGTRPPVVTGRGRRGRCCPPPMRRSAGPP